MVRPESCHNLWQTTDLEEALTDGVFHDQTLQNPDISLDYNMSSILVQPIPHSELLLRRCGAILIPSTIGRLEERHGFRKYAGIGNYQ